MHCFNSNILFNLFYFYFKTIKLEIKDMKKLLNIINNQWISVET